MLNFGKAHKTDSGIVIENKTVDSSTNQVSIQVSNYTYSPNEGDLYLISFRGLNPKNKKTHYSILKNVPDENNILSFDLQSSKMLESLNPGAKVKIRGPFMQSNQQVG